MKRPTARDLEQADELHRTARFYHGKARVCLDMAANLLAGRPMAEGIGQFNAIQVCSPDVHGLTNERGVASGESHPPARGG